MSVREGAQTVSRSGGVQRGIEGTVGICVLSKNTIIRVYMPWGILCCHNFNYAYRTSITVCTPVESTVDGTITYYSGLPD
jgi:hypothetical protein